jgi:hypothetical protein
MFGCFLPQSVTDLMYVIDPRTLLMQVFPLLTPYYNSLFEVYTRPHSSCMPDLVSELR